jgi:hypothetical protein
MGRAARASKAKRYKARFEPSPRRMESITESSMTTGEIPDAELKQMLEQQRHSLETEDAKQDLELQR